MRQHHRYLRVRGNKSQGMFRFRIHGGNHVLTARKNSTQLNLLGFEPIHSLVEIVQFLSIADIYQVGVKGYLLNEGLFVNRNGGGITEGLGMFSHLGGLQNTLLHFLNRVRVGDQ